MTNRLAALGFAVIFGAVVAASASASVIITPGNVPQTDENVLMNTGDIGNPVFGETNQTAIDVRLASITAQTLQLPSAGQARVEAVGAALTSLVIDIPGGLYESLVFNAFAGSGDITISVVDSLGGVTAGVFSVANGQNFFTITTDDLQSIVSTTLTFTTSVRDVRQVRLGGAQLLVPEPGTLALLGLGLAALGSLRSRRH